MLYSIGHSTRKAEDFLALLKQYGITYLADVRSKPYSRFNPQYRRETLKQFLENNGIAYVFMGDVLGGRPEDVSVYNEKGRADYTKLKTKDFFVKGIGRLKTASEKEVPLAYMCSEGNPLHCHRALLIAEALFEQGINTAHIDEKGLLKMHDALRAEIHKEPHRNPELF